MIQLSDVKPGDLVSYRVNLPLLRGRKVVTWKKVKEVGYSSGYLVLYNRNQRLHYTKVVALIEGKTTDGTSEGSTAGDRDAHS